MILKKKNTGTGQEYLMCDSWEVFINAAAMRKDMWVVSVVALPEGRIGAVLEPHTRTPNTSEPAE